MIGAITGGIAEATYGVYLRYLRKKGVRVSARVSEQQQKSAVNRALLL